MKRILVASVALVLQSGPAFCFDDRLDPAMDMSRWLSQFQSAPGPSFPDQLDRINRFDALRDQQMRFEQDVQDQQRALEHRMDELRRDQEYARRDAEAQARHNAELSVLGLPHN